MQKKIFSNPWWVVVGATMAIMVGNGPMEQTSFGVFLKPVTAEFGWGRSTMSGAFAMHSVITAVTVPFVGKLIDHYGVRRVVIPAIALFALNFALFSQITSAPIVFTILYSVSGLLGAGQSQGGYIKAITSWFDRRRGIALGVSACGFGLGTAWLPFVAQTYITHFGWRSAYVALAITAACISIPAVSLLVRQSPELLPAALKKDPNAAPPPGLTGWQAIKSLRFWLIAVSALLTLTVVTGSTGHFVALLTDRGFRPAVAASMMAAVGIATICGRLGTGYLLDRFFAPYVAIASLTIPLIGVILLLTGWGMPVPLISLICLGLGSGSEVDLIAYMGGRYFGLRSLGEIYGYFYATLSLGSGLGTYIMGLAFDMTHSYDAAFYVFIPALIVAGLLMTMMGPYTFPPVRRGDHVAPPKAA